MRRCKMRGVAFQEILSLALLVSVWALLDLSIYAALRAFHRRYRVCSEVFGSLSIALFFLCWMALILWTLAAFSNSNNSNGESMLTLYVLVFGGSGIFLVTPTLGGWLIRHAMRKEVTWWQGISFFTFCFLVSHIGEIWMCNTFPHFLDAMLSPANRFFSGPLGGLVLVGRVFFFWFSPLIAPLLEIAIYPFWRAYQQHRSGTYER
jgi:hypothetical protein